MGLTKGAMPKSNVGRKAIEPDAKILEGLLEFFQSEDSNPIEQDDFFVPAYIGPDDHLFEKDSRAQSEGRRYAKAIKEKMGATVKVNVYDNGKEGKALRYLWRVYKPLGDVASS